MINKEIANYTTKRTLGGHQEGTGWTRSTNWEDTGQARSKHWATTSEEEAKFENIYKVDVTDIKIPNLKYIQLLKIHIAAEKKGTGIVFCSCYLDNLLVETWLQWLKGHFDF